MKIKDWAKPQKSKKDVDEAGKVLLPPPPILMDIEDAYEVINNWRSSHSYPLHTFYVWLRKKSQEVDDRSLVARRIKRLSSIEAKMERFPHITLSKMQDIGGCRAIVSSVPKVKKLVSLYRKSGLKHRLVKKSDYIANPKDSGYRGIHLIYEYFSDKHTYWNSLRVEVQLRSRAQHAWATSVEIFGTFTNQALKSSKGDPEWLRFFVLMGSAIAMREKCPPVPGAPSDPVKLKREIKALEKKLKVKKILETYGNALKTLSGPGTKGADYFLLKLDIQKKQVTVEGFKAKNLNDANYRYMEIERSIKKEGSDAEAVLVAVESVNSLRKAYPNYFLDTQVFIRELESVLE